MSAIDVRLAARLGDFTLDVQLQLPGLGVSVLFGPSGCGKSSLLRCLAGLHRAEQGRVVVDGEVWQDGERFVATHRRAVGMVFQEPSLFPHLSVQGNLDYGRKRSAGARPGFALPAAVELLGIGHLLQRRPDTLSGGERQRVAIARALASHPRLLLLDEPLAALDARRKDEILPYLDRLHGELKLPVIYVTHAVPEVQRLADHVVLMEDGRITAQGPLQQMASRLDIALAQDEGAGVMLPCTVAERDPRWHLARLQFDGGSIWTRDMGHALGAAVRVRVLARDVSLALGELSGTSVANQWQGSVQALAPDSHPALTLALVRVGGVQIFARLTRRSAERLALAPGRAVWVQVKSVAVEQ